MMDPEGEWQLQCMGIGNQSELTLLPAAGGGGATSRQLTHPLSLLLLFPTVHGTFSFESLFIMPSLAHEERNRQLANLSMTICVCPQSTVHTRSRSSEKIHSKPRRGKFAPPSVHLEGIFSITGGNPHKEKFIRHSSRINTESVVQTVLLYELISVSFLLFH